MKALSMRHPSVSALLAGHRSVEVRSHRANHSGELLIHASATFGPTERQELERLRSLGLDLPEPSPEQRGALVGTAVLAGCHEMLPDDWDRALLPPRDGEWYAWELEDVEEFPEPIPYPGRVFLFDVPDQVLAQAVSAFTNP